MAWSDPLAARHPALPPCSRADDRPRHRRRNMQTLSAALKAKRRNVRVIVAAGLTACAVGGWALSTMSATNAATAVAAPRFDRSLPVEEAKPSLIGSYVVTGTDPDGKPYPGGGIVD